MRSPVLTFAALRAARPRFLLAAALFTPGIAGAQSVVGAVRDTRDHSAVPGAIVILLSSSGEKLGGTLVGDDGRYELRVPGAGRYALRVDLVGFRSVSIPGFDVPAHGAVTKDVDLSLERSSLPAVAVTTSSSCQRVVGESGDAARLWAEARKALEATRIAQVERRFPVTLRRFERVVSLPDSVVRSTKTSTETGVTENPFVSLPPDSIRELGYRLRRDGEEIYYAPDAAVLLSDGFVDEHCFRTKRGNGSLASLIGLAFAPTRGGRHVDVDGVLWLDSATAELRMLEFRYAPSSLARQAGGNVEFGRLPSGAYGVRRWRIWVPLQSVAQRRRRPDGAFDFNADTVVTSMREEGGEVVSALGGAGAIRNGQRLGRLTVTVFDSTRGAAMAGATVTVEGIGASAVTGADGLATLDSLADEGTFQVRFWHPRLDSLGAGMIRAPVRLTRGNAAVLNLATPSVATLAGKVCPAPVAIDSVRVVRGVAKAARDGTPYASAIVDVVWWDGAGRVHRTSAVSGDNGGFTTCVATSSPLFVSAFHESDVASAERIGAAARGVSIVPLRLTPHDGLSAADSGAIVSLGAEPLADPPRNGSSLLSGVALGSYDEAVANLRATIDGREAVLHADTVGSFTLANVMPGLHAVTFRALGYAPAKVRFRADSGTRIGLYVRLPRSSTTIAAVRVAGQRTRTGFDWTRGFVERRRRAAGGTFLSREDIERRGGESVVELLRFQPGVVVTPDRGSYRFYSRLSGGRLGQTAMAVVDPNTKVTDAPAPKDLPLGLSEECEFTFIVDGQVYGTSQDAIVGGVVLQIRSSEIEAMEIYPGGATIPFEFGSSNIRCGVIAIWTRSRLGKSGQ